MHRRQASFWGWNHASWIETLCKSPADFCNRHALAGDQVRPHLAAVAYLLGCFQDIPALGTISSVTLPREVFGRFRGNDSIHTAVGAITAWGYGAGRAYDLRTTLGVLFLANRSPDLRDLTVSFLEEQRRLSNTSRRSGSILTLSKVLMTLGLTGRALSHPPQSDRVKAMVGVCDGVPSQWLEWVEKWFSTSTLERKTRRMYRLSLFKVGRWLAAVHPQCLGPGDWTREIAADWVAAVCRMQIGDWAHSNIYVKGRVGKPLAASSRANHLNSIGAFFRDCQEWEWIPRRFDPRRCFSIPRSVRGLIAPNPRVIADDLWAKLLWAGLNLL
jgi:hypothetical protein